MKAAPPKKPAAVSSKKHRGQNKKVAAKPAPAAAASKKDDLLSEEEEVPASKNKSGESDDDSQDSDRTTLETSKRNQPVREAKVKKGKEARDSDGNQCFIDGFDGFECYEDKEGFPIDEEGQRCEDEDGNLLVIDENLNLVVEQQGEEEEEPEGATES